MFKSKGGKANKIERFRLLLLLVLYSISFKTMIFVCYPENKRKYPNMKISIIGHFGCCFVQCSKLNDNLISLRIKHFKECFTNRFKCHSQDCLLLLHKTTLVKCEKRGRKEGRKRNPLFPSLRKKRHSRT